jgi:hypothetical protein
MHDQTIDTEMSEFLPTPCLRKFTELEMYFCFGCYYNESVAILPATKTIQLCDDYARRLWGASTN